LRLSPDSTPLKGVVIGVPEGSAIRTTPHLAKKTLGFGRFAQMQQTGGFANLHVVARYQHHALLSRFPVRKRRLAKTVSGGTCIATHAAQAAPSSWR
jgi:hypothetical protein